MCVILYSFIHSHVHSFIHSGYFYSASWSLLLRGTPDTARTLCRNFTPKRYDIIIMVILLFIVCIPDLAQGEILTHCVIMAFLLFIINRIKPSRIFVHCVIAWPSFFSSRLPRGNRPTRALKMLQNWVTFLNSHDNIVMYHYVLYWKNLCMYSCM